MTSSMGGCDTYYCAVGLYPVIYNGTYTYAGYKNGRPYWTMPNPPFGDNTIEWPVGATRYTMISFGIGPLYQQNVWENCPEGLYGSGPGYVYAGTCEAMSTSSTSISSPTSMSTQSSTSMSSPTSLSSPSSASSTSVSSMSTQSSSSSTLSASSTSVSSMTSSFRADGFTFGCQVPPFDTQAVPWTGWTILGTMTPADYTAPWGDMQMTHLSQFVSPVRDTLVATSRTVTISTADCEAATGSGTIYYRSSATPFAQDAGLPAWNLYVGAFVTSHRYFQIRTDG